MIASSKYNTLDEVDIDGDKNGFPSQSLSWVVSAKKSCKQKISLLCPDKFGKTMTAQFLLGNQQWTLAYWKFSAVETPVKLFLNQS